MTQNTKRHIIASVGTALVMFLLFLLLWFVYITAYVPEEEEGVEIAFGEVEEAGGYMAEQSEAMPLPAPEPSAPVQPAAPAVEEHITTEDPEALALAEAKRKQEAQEKARVEAERKAKEDAERKKAQDLIGGLNFGQSGNDTGSGDGKGAGLKSNPVGGEGVFNGNRYSLKGRVPKTIPNPEGYFNENAKVVVQIWVNANGDVVSAKWTTGTQNASQSFIKMAETAALKSKWDAVPGAQVQVGTIEYIFSVK